MKRISYNVKCANSKTIAQLKKDKNYINKKIAEIIFKRREKKCYENCSN